MIFRVWLFTGPEKKKNILWHVLLNYRLRVINCATRDVFIKIGCGNDEYNSEKSSSSFYYSHYAREIFKLSLLIRNPIRCVNNTNDPKISRFISNDTAHICDLGKKLKSLNRLKTFLKLSLLMILNPILFQVFVAFPLHHLLLTMTLLNFYFSLLLFLLMIQWYTQYDSRK